jgi:4-amino-4-deoxy-L-arabinose transferase-like glycosyltransferase
MRLSTTASHWTVGWRPWALLALLCLVLYAPGIASVPPLDRDEARFAQATRQMLETGDFVRIRFQDEARNKKPIGIYWLQAASVSLFSTPESTAIWPYRLPSLLGATSAVLLVFAFGRRLVGAEAALVGAALLASSLSLVVEAHLGKTDAVMLACVAAAQGALGEIYRRARAGQRVPARLALVFWVAEGLGALVKGPIPPLVAGLTIAALCLADHDARWLRRLRWQWGVPLALMILLPWVIAVERATAGAFLADAVGHDMLGKVAGAQESHGAPPGYYLLLVFATFWPGSLFVLVALAAAWRARGDAAVRFLLAWLIPAWLLFELVPTKLPHYGLPLYPALALLAGRVVVLGPAPRKWMAATGFALWAVVSVALAAGVFAAPMQLAGDGTASPALLAIALVPSAAIISMLIAQLRRSVDPAPGDALRCALLAAFVFVPVFTGLLPRLDRIWLSREAAAMVAQAGPRGAPVDAVGYTEPSLVFLLGTATRFVSPVDAAADLAAARTRLALVGNRDEDAFLRGAAEHGIEPRRLGTVEGIDYSNGCRMALTLFDGGKG